MIIGVVKIKLYIMDSFSLKDKRQVVKSIVERLRSRFNVSCAEVELNDVWKSAVIAAVCVSNSHSHVDSVISKVVDFVENDGRVEIEEYTTETL